MGKYILKRILFFIPTLIIISLLAFIISINAPGDPLAAITGSGDLNGEQNSQAVNARKEKEKWRVKLGLDLPVFYFSVTGISTPDTLYKVYDQNEHDALKRLIATYGNWQEISAWNAAAHTLEKTLQQITIDSAAVAAYGKNAAFDVLAKSVFTAHNMIGDYEAAVIKNDLGQLQRYFSDYSFYSPAALALQRAHDQFSAMESNVTRYKNYIPAIHFYPYNQYHRWIFGDGNWLTGKGSVNCRGLIRGDFGYSYQTKLPVSNIIGERIRWSLFFTFISILLAYLISLPIGLRAAAKKNSLFDRTSSVVLFILYSMPAFWVATILLMTFANTDVLQWFPASGIQPVTGIPQDAGWLEIIRLRLPYLILPTIAYTYSQLAFLSRIMRVSTLEIISQDYIRTARAKGLSERKVIYKHAFRNSLLPIITVFSNIFPLAISGSVILETIFTIPGMGQQIYYAISAKDYPVIIDVFTLTGVLTLAGYLVADVLYAMADPRITYSSK